MEDQSRPSSAAKPAPEPAESAPQRAADPAAAHRASRSVEASATPVVAIIPALNESERITATIAGVRQLAEVSDIIVVDDGSSDTTAQLARDAGVQVVQHPRRRGKAAALQTAVDQLLRATPSEQIQRYALLFVDADLADSAANLAPLIEPVVAGAADMTIAILPPQSTPGGGHGFVVRLSRGGIRRLTNWRATQPLSGMRCLTWQAFFAARPLAGGWGVETGLTIDLLRHGFRVLEVSCDLHHRVTGRSWGARWHRFRQFLGVLRALAVRQLRYGFRAPATD